MLYPFAPDDSLFDTSPETEAIIQPWLDYLHDKDREFFLDCPEESRSYNDDGDFYTIPTPEGLVGDFTFFIPAGGHDTPHYHDETEVHIPLNGKAWLSIGQQILVMERGPVVPIRPKIGHFLISTEHYDTGLLRLPNEGRTFWHKLDSNHLPDSFNKPLLDITNMYEWERW